MYLSPISCLPLLTQRKVDLPRTDGQGLFPYSPNLWSWETLASPNTEALLTIRIVWDWGPELKWQRQFVPEVHFLWMLKSWHSWLAQYKYGHPRAVALFEFICWIAVMWFLWQPSDSLNWWKPVASLSVVAAWRPVLQKKPKHTVTLQKHTGQCISISMRLAHDAWRRVRAHPLHRSWPLSSLAAWL